MWSKYEIVQVKRVVCTKWMVQVHCGPEISFENPPITFSVILQIQKLRNRQRNGRETVPPPQKW